jgi:hypothetical protein
MQWGGGEEGQHLCSFEVPPPPRTPDSKSVHMESVSHHLRSMRERHVLQAWIRARLQARPCRHGRAPPSLVKARRELTRTSSVSSTPPQRAAYLAIAFHDRLGSGTTDVI